MRETSDIPIFPLSNTLFPGGRLALRVFEPRYVEMTRHCLREDSVFGVSLIQAGFEVGTPAVPCLVGCSARIVDAQETAPNRYTLTCVGERRFRILERWNSDSGLIRAQLQWLPKLRSQALAPRYAGLAAILQRVARELGAQAFTSSVQSDDAAWVAQRMAELLPVTPEQRQRWLEMDEVGAILDQQLDVLGGLHETF
ncbi:hypothetical protein SAMN04488038_11460 [Solimonas aquatica]|uniref:Lon N-terminal domain-containing protein n=1 Tax=Solimonas aquatica TaxID=489703 RepID=A0A1H9KVI4_9GAMM|nr:LON peptidase substrate-binding domain-containing protein [Solimonas aquatica]SER03212.1 hypothetical protein SAMN04488038_11460 [Solimonas aquatica]